MDAEKNHQEVLGTTNWIEEVVMTNNRILSNKWEVTHDWIDRQVEAQVVLEKQIWELESLSGLQQAALQHCQDTVVGLEETVAQLVAMVKKLEKSVC